MARTALAVQAVSGNNGAQLVEAGADQANGNNFANDGKTRLIIHNGDASPRTATIKSVACSHGRTGDVAVVVAASSRGYAGPFATDIFNQSDGTVNVDWSAGTTAACKATAVQHST